MDVDKKTLPLVLALFAGVCSGLLGLKLLFPLIPNDLQRVKFLLAALEEPDSELRVAVFGNSVAMGGVDARVLSEELPGHPLAYNLSTTGQQLAETYLYLRALPESVDAIVVVLVPPLLQFEPFIPRNVYNAYTMYGYELDPASREALTAIFPEQAGELFSIGPLRHVFDSRWNVFQGINGSIRALFRKDLDLERATSDLYFPAAYTEPVKGRKLDNLVSEYIRQIGEPTFKISETQKRLVDAIADWAAAEDVRLVGVVPPYNPAIKRFLGPDYLADAARSLRSLFVRGDALLVDGSDLLSDPNSFVDHVHITQEGAGALTREIAKHMRAR